MNIIRIVQAIVDRRLGEVIESHSCNSSESAYNKGQIDALSWVSAIVETLQEHGGDVVQAEKRE